MATNFGATTQRSAALSVSDITVDDILAAQAKVGAPNTARVNTSSGGYSSPDGETVLPYSLTFTWTEDSTTA